MTMAYLTRTDATHNIERFYIVDVTYDLFGGWVVAREWGRRGSPRTYRHCNRLALNILWYVTLSIPYLVYRNGETRGSKDVLGPARNLEVDCLARSATRCCHVELER